MGLIHKGIPEKLALKIKKKFDLSYFIETGTHTGRTTLWASRYFRQVYTIEYYAKYVALAYENCQNRPNIDIVYGNSATDLTMLLKLIPKDQNALIWLDAHWSKDLKEKRPQFGECPVLSEIEQINGDDRSHVIMIDDARLFTDPPPKPHNPEHWPTYIEILDQLSKSKIWQDIQITEDVILAQPKREKD